MAIDWDAEAKRRVAARVEGFSKHLARLNRKPRKSRTAAKGTNGPPPLLGQPSTPERAEDRDPYSASSPAIDRAFQRGIEMSKEQEERDLAENCRWLLLSPEEREAEIAAWIPRVQELIEDFGKIREPRMRFALQASYRKKLEELMDAVERDDKSPFTA